MERWTDLTPLTQPRLLSFAADPRRVLRAWPAERPLAALWSSRGSNEGARRWSRWTILAAPVGAVRTDVEPGRAGGNGGARLLSEWRGGAAAPVRFEGGVDPVALLGMAAASTGGRVVRPRQADEPPFTGGWIAALSYDLGAAIEPRACARRREPIASCWPRMLMQYCPAAYVHDGATGRWWVVGDPQAAETLPDAAELFASACEGGVPPEGALSASSGARAVGRRRASACAEGSLTDLAIYPGAEERGFVLGEPGETTGECARARYQRHVARVVEYIRAGDVFQANIAHDLGGAFAGSMRACFAELVDRARPWFGAYIEDGPWERGGRAGRRRAALASISPELFLDFDPATRVVTTRPIKGTRRGDQRPDDLVASGKDSAELAMIVDLMRNDLGRVCEFGSVVVPEARLIERHAAGDPGAEGVGVLHGVATVQGRLRGSLRVDDLLRATFPGGSITGAPKIRAMQIIDELEHGERGPYTGSIGYISDCGRACFNIAIRTALLREAAGRHARGREPAPLDVVEQGTWSYSVGAGIVADSDPGAEWEETLAKAEPMLGLCREHQEVSCLRPTPPPQLHPPATPAIA